METTIAKLQKIKLDITNKVGELEQLTKEFNYTIEEFMKISDDNSSGGGGGTTAGGGGIAAAGRVEKIPIYSLAITMFPGDPQKKVTTLLRVVFGKGEKSFIRAEVARKLKCDFVRCEKKAISFIGYDETPYVSYVTKSCDLSWRLYGTTDYCQENVCVMPEMLAGCDLVLSGRFFNLGKSERTKGRYQVTPLTNYFNRYQNIETTVLDSIGGDDDYDSEDQIVHIQNPISEFPKYLGISESYMHVGDTEGQSFVVIALVNSQDSFMSEKAASRVGSLQRSTRAELTLVCHSGERMVVPITKKWKCYWRMGEGLFFNEQLFVMPGLNGCDILLSEAVFERKVNLPQCTILSLVDDDNDDDDDPSLSVQALRTYAAMTFKVEDEYDENFPELLP